MRCSVRYPFSQILESQSLQLLLKRDDASDNRIPEKMFRQVFRILLTLLAIRLLVGAATELGWLEGIV